MKTNQDKSHAPQSQSDSHLKSHIILGKDEHGHYETHHGREHVMSVAPARSGKSVSLVVPNLLTWNQSVVVTDIRGEHYCTTGWWRSLFSHVVYFNPMDPNSARYNPLFEIRKGEHAIKDALMVAKGLETRPRHERNPIWDEGRQDLLAATILYVLYTRPSKTLTHVLELIISLETTLQDMLECETSDTDVNQYIHNTVTHLLMHGDRAKAGFIEEAKRTLKPWNHPDVERVTSTSDFRLSDLQHAVHPVSLYLVMHPGDVAHLAPLMRLMLTQLTDVMTRKVADTHRVLMLLDDFAQLGHIEVVERAMTYSSAYGVLWWIIAQSYPQLEKLYGKKHSFLSNCHIQLASRCNDHQSATMLSHMLGSSPKHVYRDGEFRSKGLLDVWADKMKVRPLMTKAELLHLSPERQLIMKVGEPAVLAHKTTYYDDPFFLPRFKNKRWTLPSTRGTDFPSSHLTHDWLNTEPLTEACSKAVHHASHTALHTHDEVNKEHGWTRKLEQDELEEVSRLLTKEMTIAQCRHLLIKRAQGSSPLEGSLELADTQGKLTPYNAHTGEDS